jgi:hypothetical protein
VPVNGKQWLHEKWSEKVIRKLKKNFINGFAFPSAREAMPEILAHIPNGAVVGLGDSETLFKTGIVVALRKADCLLLNPCAVTGFCYNCKPPLTICSALTALRGHRVYKDRITVFLIGEELGL